MDNKTLVRLAMRAYRIAQRNIGGRDGYREEVARRIQEVWEEEGADLSSLSTFPCHDEPEREMRQVYRERKDLPEEMHCDYCGELVEVRQAIAGKFCKPECEAS